MAWQPKVVDRRHEALGGQSNDRPLSVIRKIGWHYTATIGSFITNHERYWRDYHGWDRGGYHAYIDRYGTIYINYDLTRMTWGVANNNWDTVHMSLEARNAGDYTEAQIKSRDWLTRKWMKELNLPASAVKGHWEIYNNTVCPGYTKVEMNNFRAQLAKAAPVVAGASVHVVKAGETLWVLAKKYNMSVDQLKTFNGLDSNLIVVGQSLKVKGSVATPSKPKLKSLEVVAQEVIDGKWKNYPERQKLLEKEGYDYHDVQAIVDRLQGNKSLVPIETIAREVIEGKHGNGDERKRNLEAKGYNYAEVQAEVDRTLKANTPKAVKKAYVQLAAHEPTWRVYRLGAKPVAGNEVGFLAPRQYGGLEYQILGYEDGGTCAIIQTQAFGKVKIFIKDPSAKIVTR